MVKEQKIVLTVIGSHTQGILNLFIFDLWPKLQGQTEADLLILDLKCL
jgi:hypothetical protein